MLNLCKFFHFQLVFHSKLISIILIEGKFMIISVTINLLNVYDGFFKVVNILLDSVDIFVEVPMLGSNVLHRFEQFITFISSLFR